MNIEQKAKDLGVEKIYSHIDGEFIYGFKLENGIQMSEDFVKTDNASSLFRSAHYADGGVAITSQKEAETAYEAFYKYPYKQAKKAVKKT